MPRGTEHINKTYCIFTTLMRKDGVYNKLRGVSMFKVFLQEKMSEREKGSSNDRGMSILHIVLHLLETGRVYFFEKDDF